MAKNENRCWPGYEPVKGKKKNAQGSCRPKAESKTTAGEKEFRAKRRKQLDEWQEQHKGTRKSAAQHLQRPGTKTKTTARKKSAQQSPGGSSRTRRAA
jgi:hypothetical protein